MAIIQRTRLLGEPTTSDFAGPLLPPKPVATTQAFAQPKLVPLEVKSAPTVGQAPTLDEKGKISGTLLSVSVFTSDPSDPKEGDLWIRGDLNELRWREGGTTYKVAGTAV